MYDNFWEESGVGSGGERRRIGSLNAPQRNLKYGVSSDAYGRPHFNEGDVGTSGIGYSPPALGAWGEQQSTKSTAPYVGLGGTEGFISDPKNGAKVGVGQPDLPAPEEM